MLKYFVGYKLLIESRCKKRLFLLCNNSVNYCIIMFNRFFTQCNLQPI